MFLIHKNAILDDSWKRSIYHEAKSLTAHKCNQYHCHGEKKASCQWECVGDAACYIK